MPQNWKTYKLGEIITLNYGKALTTKNRKVGDIPVYSSAGITGCHNQALVEEKSIIVGRKGTVGAVYKSLSPFFCIDTAYYIRKSDCHCDIDFLYYLLQSIGLDRLNYDSAVPGLNREVAYDQIVNIPESLLEQQAIAEILSSLDDKIELNLQMNKTLEEMAMTLYKHWFMDFGPFRNGEFVDSELGKIPKGWEVKGILEIADLLSGGTPKTRIEEYWNGNICWVSAKDIGNGSIYINNTAKRITKLGVEKSSTKVLPEDTVILVARGSVGKFGMIAKGMAMNQSCYGLFTRSEFSQGMVYLMFSYLIESFQRQAYGSVFDTITTSTFKSTKVVGPIKEIILMFRDEIDPLFGQLRQNIIEIEYLTKTRDTLLPKLINGEVRVKEVKKQLEEIM